MPKFVQVCNDDVLEVFEDATLEHVSNDSQEYADSTGKEVTIYEIVAEKTFESNYDEEEEEEEEE